MCQCLSASPHFRNAASLNLSASPVFCNAASLKVLPILQGEFSLEGRYPDVRENVVLVQGLFNESLPKFIKKHYRTRNPVDITYLHIDCDLYAGKELL